LYFLISLPQNNESISCSFARYWSLIIRSFSCAPSRVADRDVEKRQESPAGPLEMLNFHGNSIETARFPALSRHRCSRHVPLTFTRTYVYMNTRRSVFFSFKEAFQSIIPPVFHQRKKTEKKKRNSKCGIVKWWSLCVFCTCTYHVRIEKWHTHVFHCMSQSAEIKISFKCIFKIEFSKIKITRDIRETRRWHY